MNEIEKKLLEIIVFFDIFDFPLNEKDFLNYGKQLTTNDLQQLLDNKKIREKNGFYFLLGREEIIEIRKSRKKNSLKKIKRAQKMAKWLSILPFIKMVGLGNIMGELNFKPTSDIDLFIITTKNKIWTARWWSAGWAKLFNLRPRPNKIQNKFCFSFYLTEDNLNLEKITLEDDIYFYYWLANLIVLYDEKNYFENFVKENTWSKNLLEQDYKIKPALPGLKKFFEKISGNWFENFIQKIQLVYLPKKLKKLSKDEVGVIIKNNILKFHANDRRMEIRGKWKDKIQNLK